MLLQALFLGMIQGLTEFIPVSSSGHLIAIPKLFGWDYLGKTFDVALHLGTALALLAYYRRDWSLIVRGFCSHVFNRVAYDRQSRGAVGGQMLVPILVACVPAAVVGYLWDDFIESTLGQWYPVASALAVVALIMVGAERAGKKVRNIEQMNYADYLLIGCAQALALLPGVSRSGITISAGLFANLEREAAARFSFLLSTPIILGAGAFKLAGLAQTGVSPGMIGAMIAGFVTSALFGYLAIGFLMRHLRSRTMDVFAAYRICFAGLMAAVFVLRA